MIKTRYDMRELTPRYQYVLDAIQSDPTRTLRSIADDLSVSREWVRVISENLRKDGYLDAPAVQLRKNALAEQEEAQRAIKKQRRLTWRRMMFISLRQRLRHMARIRSTGIDNEYHMPGINTICQFAGCTQSVRARGFCAAHYGRLRETGALWVRRRGKGTCTHEGCVRSVYARNLCTTHYNVFRRKNHEKSILPSHNSSGYRGVSWDATAKRWSVYIRNPEGKQEFLGAFDDKETAGRAYDTAARKYKGDTAKLNFPDEFIEVGKPEPRPRGGVGPNGGAYWDTRKQRYVVRITRGGKTLYRGSFLDIDTALAARAQALKELPK